MASASLAVVAFLAVVATAVSQSMRQNSPDQNTWNAMVRVKPSCENTYNNVVAPFFANDPACKAQVEKALKTYNKTECPETTSGSFVWNCMSGWNGNSTDPNRVNAWRSFLMNCEILYIAQRVDTGESEDGFVFRENSCFRRFPDMGAFVSWLSTYNPDDNAAAGLTSNAITVFFSALLAVVALRLL